MTMLNKTLLLCAALLLVSGCGFFDDNHQLQLLPQAQQLEIDVEKSQINDAFIYEFTPASSPYMSCVLVYHFRGNAITCFEKKGGEQ